MSERKICRAIVYRQGPKGDMDPKSWKFVGQIMVDRSNIKRVFGPSPKAMANDLARNIREEEKDSWSLEQLDHDGERYLRAKGFVENNQDVKRVGLTDFQRIETVLTSRLGEKL